MYNYTWIDQGEDGNLAFEFTEGPWSNMPFQFGTIKFIDTDESENGEASMSFDFQMLSEEHKHMAENEDFVKDVGEVLVEAITEAVSRMDEDGDREVSNQESGTE